MTPFAALFVAFFQITINFGAPCQGFQNAKKRIYGFRPAELTEAERTEKSREMDEFWKYTRQLGPSGIACLSEQLKSEKNDGFFLFDGASLLYGLDQSEASTAIVVDAVKRSDFSDIDPPGYIRLVLALSHHGAEVGPLGVKYLTYPKVDADVPQHAMKLGRLEGGVMLFGSMPETTSDPALIPMLSSTNSEIKSTAAMLLGFNMTEESFEALRSPSLMQSLTPAARKELESITHHTALAPMPPPKWNREEVLNFLRRMPHTEAEYKALEPEFENYTAGLAKSRLATKNLSRQEQAVQMQREIEESEPFFSIAGLKRFQESAIQTLTADDLAELREERRKSITDVSDEVLDEYFAYTQIILGVINRLDLYRDARTH
jgi:hypothetical protein